MYMTHVYPIDVELLVMVVKIRKCRKLVKVVKCTSTIPVFLPVFRRSQHSFLCLEMPPPRTDLPCQQESTPAGSPRYLCTCTWTYGTYTLAGVTQS